MATWETKRRCPYCGASIKLGDCPIVATSFEGVELLEDGAGVDDEALAGEFKAGVRLRSRRTPIDFLPTLWPVIGLAPAQRPGRPTAARPRRSRLEDLLGAGAGPPVAAPTLPPLDADDAVDPDDLPARACPRCAHPLTRNIDERPAMVIAVVGVNRVGKTHLLASSLTQAYRGDALARIGCREFVPDDATSSRYMNDYFYPLFRDGLVLDATQAEDHAARFKPLVFNTTIDGARPFSLALHDIAGEVLADPRKRAQAASHLRAARGIIFVVDPRDIDGLRGALPDWLLSSNEIAFDQGSLLAECLRAGGALGLRSTVPVAITLAKADLLPMAVGHTPGFLAPAPASESREDFLARVEGYSTEIARFLGEHGAHSILTPARNFQHRLRGGNGAVPGVVSFHAVSALGCPPDSAEQLTGPVQPLNCVDPLAYVLDCILAR